MIKLKNSNFSILLATIFLMSFFLMNDTAFATTAKERYLLADSSYKKLKNSSSKQQKESEWLNCISKYEIIYRVEPDSSWAPAGMYKASRLYLTLSKLSGKKTYEDQAIDLLQRIQNRYPKSSYSGRAVSLMKSINISPPPPSESQKTLTSLKYRTKDDGKIKTFKEQIAANERKKQDQEKEKQEKEKFKKEQSAYEQKIVTPDALPEPSGVKPTGDGTITDLRFWSNPEYTRIVVNANAEREYSHRLLKKDPDIDKPFQRLYVDIEQSILGKGVAEHTPINDNLLKQARAGQYLPHTVRVVVDIKSFENYKIFSLKDPFRIVIDVWGKDSNGSQESGNIASTETYREEHSIITTDNLQSSDIARQLALGVRKIVIDPGHGGADPGAPGYYKNVWEKHIVLKLAKKLAVILRDKLKCTVVLTRSKDERLSLEERTAIANTEKADLFISLHCNAARNKNLTGIETYILNLATDDQAIAVAARENATSRKNISDLEYILSDLMKHAKIEESTRLANVVQAAFITGMKTKYSGVNDLGVKKAPFYVLLGARMPSILVETSFISNPTECKRLMSNDYQAHVAQSIADGIEKYIQTTNPKLL